MQQIRLELRSTRHKIYGLRDSVSARNPDFLHEVRVIKRVNDYEPAHPYLLTVQCVSLIDDLGNAEGIVFPPYASDESKRNDKQCEKKCSIGQLGA
jgi:hypothetical protein